MDYKDGNVYLSARAKDTIAKALLAQMSILASLRDQSYSFGISGYDYDWLIGSHKAILNSLNGK